MTKYSTIRRLSQGSNGGNNSKIQVTFYRERYGVVQLHANVIRQTRLRGATLKVGTGKPESGNRNPESRNSTTLNPESGIPQFHHSDYNHNRHFHPTCDKNLMIRAMSTKECPTHSVELLQHSVLKGNM